MLFRSRPVPGATTLAAEPLVDGLGHGGYVAGRIGGGHMGGTRGFGQGRNAGAGAGRSLHVDFRAALLSIGLRHQPFDGHIDMFGVAKVYCAVGKGDLEAFGEDVDAVRRAEPEAGYVETFEQIEDLKHVNAAGRRRRRDNEFVSSVRSPQRVAQYGAVGAEIFHSEDAAALPDVVDDPVPEWTLVEDVRSSLGDVAQGRGKVGLNEACARRRRLPPGQKNPGRFRKSAEMPLILFHGFGQVTADGKPVFGDMDGGLDHGLQIQDAPASERFAPSLQRARNPGRKGADLVGVVFGPHVVRPGVGHGRIHVLRRLIGCTGVGVEDDGRTVGETDVDPPGAEQTHHLWFDHVEGKERGHGGVDGVPAQGIHMRARRRGDRMVGRNHAARSGRRLFLNFKGRAGSISPMMGHVDDAGSGPRRSAGRAEFQD